MTLGITVIVNVWSAYNPAPSIALIVIVYVPGVVNLPVSLFSLNESPSGRLVSASVSGSIILYSAIS